MDNVIETPHEDDVEDIHALMREAWLATYPNEALNITSEALTAHFDADDIPKRTERHIQYIKNLSPDQFYKIARHNGDIVGVCRGVQCEEYAQLQSLYVLPEYQGRGVGSALWSSFYTWTNPKKPILVHVATYNTRAIAFYASKGFVDTGKRFTEDRHTLPNGATIPEMELFLRASPKSAL